MTEIKYHTIEDWDKPRNGLFEIIVDAWWLVDKDDNPLFFDKQNYPQCDRNKTISIRCLGGEGVKQIPVVYIPIRPQDYV